MIMKRDKDARGPTDTAWLMSKHSFSFGHYYDPEHMGFGPLRVINEDRVVPGAGFETHPHSNMEIISYVISGELAHKDSMGHGSTIKPGEVQLMSAGSGITHSEFNASRDDPVHFLQIWIMPNVENQAPSYQQKRFDIEEFHNCFKSVVSPEGRQGSLLIKQDARVWLGRFDDGVETRFPAEKQRRYWLQVVGGSMEINGERGLAGDGFGIESEGAITFESSGNTDILLFDLP